MEKENEKVLASGPKGDETAAGENSNYGTELQKGGGRDELEEREEVEKPPPSPFFYSSKQTPPLSPFNHLLCLCDAALATMKHGVRQKPGTVGVDVSLSLYDYSDYASSAAIF
ncbi:unnamed protein product [Pleuronectes platessa]|uniref:Uncharacterized protein n=1 Tax=Pleuronectes platessa TaxID=8262 RepID=A0A9N7TNI8_PLEPL|nr:unnamed protein product [Pleuronectes platessa]